MSSIAPTISRKIYYVPTLEDIALGMTRQGTTEHVDATIVYVDEQAGTVNLRITDHAGSTHIRHGVAVGDEPQPGQAHWMGYQIGQAKAGQAAQIQSSLVGTLAAGGTAGEVSGQIAQLQNRAASVGEYVEHQKAMEAAAGSQAYQEPDRLNTSSPSIATFQAAVEAPATYDQQVGNTPAAPSGEPLVAGNVVGD